MPEFNCLGCGAHVSSEDLECRSCGEPAPATIRDPELGCDMCGEECDPETLVMMGPGQLRCRSCADDEASRDVELGNLKRDDDARNDAYDRKRLGEALETSSFDRFMRQTLLVENGRKRIDAPEASPQRKLARSYQEHPLGRTRIKR